MVPTIKPTGLLLLLDALQLAIKEFSVSFVAPEHSKEESSAFVP
jgi:hypothetical protein